MFYMEPPKLSRAVASVVKQLLDEAGISQRELSKRTGISPTTLHGRLEGLRPFRLDEIEMIAGVFNVDANDIMQRAAVSAAA